MRPESLAFFDRFSERCLADLDEAKEKGIKIAGLYCLFAPTEMVRAVGAIPVSLCGMRSVKKIEKKVIYSTSCHAPSCHAPGCHAPTCHAPSCHSPACHAPA